MHTLYCSSNIYVSCLQNTLLKDHLNRCFKKNCEYHCIESIQSLLFGFSPDCVSHSVLILIQEYIMVCVFCYENTRRSSSLSFSGVIKMQISEEAEICSKYCADTFPCFQHCHYPSVFLVSLRLFLLYKL